MTAAGMAAALQAEAAAAALEPEVRRYYSTSPNMMIHPVHGNVVVNGANGVKLEREGEQVLFFNPCGNDYGYLDTADPRVWAWIEAQIKKGRQDLMTEAVFLEKIRTPEHRLAAAQEEVAKRDALIEQMKAQIAQQQQELRRDQLTQDVRRK